VQQLPRLHGFVLLPGALIKVQLHVPDASLHCVALVCAPADVWTSCHPCPSEVSLLLYGAMPRTAKFETCPACRRKQEGWGLPQQLLSFRTVNARTSASILQRPSRDGEAAQEYADPQMQAMAQVWAHPEDLPLYPVSPFFPHLFSERRSSRICRRCSEVMSHSLSL